MLKEDMPLYNLEEEVKLFSSAKLIRYNKEGNEYLMSGIDDTAIVANGYEFISSDTDNAPIYQKNNIQIVKRKGIGGDNVVISYKGGK